MSHLLATSPFPFDHLYKWGSLSSEEIDNYVKIGMDVLFINPRTELALKSKIFHREPPNGLLLLSAVLENTGFDVAFLDWAYNTADLKSYLAEEPKIVGITSLTNTHNLAMKILKKVKESQPDVITLYGGPHATFKYAEILRKNKDVNYVLCGEADLTILEFVRAIFSSNMQNFFQIPNLAFRINGKIHYNESYIPANLDNLPLPARHLIDLQNYDVGTIIVNRGCPFNCAFCVRQRIFQQVRFRKIINVVHEMQVLSRLGFQFVNLYDNLNISEQYALKLCQEIEKSKISLNWGCELRADKISAELANALKKANCKVIAVGVESGDPKVLQIINKNQDIKMVKKGINAAKKAGLAIQAYFIVGLPGETHESFIQTCKLLDELALEPGIDRVNFFAATPYPGTSFYECPEKYGIQILHENWDLYDNEHLILKLNSISFTELESIFKEAKEIEKEYVDY